MAKIKFSDYDIEFADYDITWDKVQYEAEGTMSFGGTVSDSFHKFKRTIEGDV